MTHVIFIREFYEIFKFIFFYNPYCHEFGKSKRKGLLRGMSQPITLLSIYIYNSSLKDE